MICPNCKAEMKEIDVFCMNCGAELSATDNSSGVSLNKEKSVETTDQELLFLDTDIDKKEMNDKEDSTLDIIPEESSEEPELFVFEFNHEVIEAEEENPLAIGLPSWDILPPETVSRRRRKL